MIINERSKIEKDSENEGMLVVSKKLGVKYATEFILDFIL